MLPKLFSYIENERALQIALGNIDINTGERHADFDPDSFKVQFHSNFFAIWKFILPY